MVGQSLQSDGVYQGDRSRSRSLLRWTTAAIAIVVGLTGWTGGAIANSNFGRVNIASSRTQSIQGHTGGSMPLSSIAPEDQARNVCIGYGDADPDHILALSNRRGAIAIEVSSNGNDTTLVIEGPDGTVYCNDDGGSGSDARIQGRNWTDGEYRVWVGAFEPGVRYDYTLVVE